MKKIIGIDIGGTTIKADVYDDKGNSLYDYREIDSLTLIMITNQMLF